MEMNSDLIAIQGILSSLVRVIGDFTKIKHKGGNEMKISLVIKELDDFLISKQYIDKRKSNKNYHKELEHITFFLIINTEFENISFEKKEFAHLVNVMPLLSKCLLANITLELDLSEYYCLAFHKLSHICSEELLIEFIPCLKKTGPEQALEHTYIFVINIITKIGEVDLDASDYKVRKVVENLEDITSEMLFIVSGLNLDHMQSWSKLRIYKHMGFTLLKLLKLLQHCQIENAALGKTIDFLIRSCCSILKAVTIEVFCAWAEVQHRGEPLQSVVGAEAFHVTEKFVNFKPGAELLQMLKSIAKKPKTLNEMIQDANTSTIIMKVNECDSNQKRWFTALLNSQIFQSKESMDCLKVWNKLCSLENVSRLLSLSINYKSNDVANLVILCASNLTEADLLLVVKRFYHQHGMKHSLNGDNVQNKLVTIVNKLEKAQGDVTKEILLLFLQDPETVLCYLYKECVKSQVILRYLTDIYRNLGDIIEIEGLHVKVMENVMKEVKVNSDNVKNYEELLLVLCESTFNKDKVIKLCKSYTELYLREELYEDLNYACQLYYAVEKNYSSLFLTAVNILEKCRWSILEFSVIKEDLCEKSIDVIVNATEAYGNVGLEDGCTISKNVLNEFYVSRISSNSDINFFEYVCPHFNVKRHANGISYLIKLLPVCVPKEWVLVSLHISNHHGIPKLLELLTDTLILLCHVMKTQITKNNCVVNGLKFCLQNYGMILKNIIKPSRNLEIDNVMAKNICRILREIPDEIRQVEGMSLVSLLSDESLKNLIGDKSFVYFLGEIGDVNISKVIAKRMLA